LLFSLLITFLFINLAKANPTVFNDNLGTIPPDINTKPPVVSQFAPKNYTVYATNVIPLFINVSVGESSTADSKYIGEIYYKADWQTKNISIYEYNPTKDIYSTEPVITQFSKTLNLTGVPDGNHSLIVYAKERGAYYSYTDYSAGNVWYEYYYLFEIEGSSSVFFTVATTAPSVSVPSIQDATFYSPNVDLSFIVNEQTSRTAYSLDGNDNVTITGNATLSGLSVGVHNVTVYAWDAAGNVGASETITFTIAEPASAAIIATASGASVIIILGCLLVYFKKRKH
jgi:hypothetical protein